MLLIDESHVILQNQEQEIMSKDIDFCHLQELRNVL